MTSHRRQNKSWSKLRLKEGWWFWKGRSQLTSSGIGIGRWCFGRTNPNGSDRNFHPRMTAHSRVCRDLAASQVVESVGWRQFEAVSLPDAARCSQRRPPTAERYITANFHPIFSAGFTFSARWAALFAPRFTTPHQPTIQRYRKRTKRAIFKRASHNPTYLFVFVAGNFQHKLT